MSDALLDSSIHYISLIIYMSETDSNTYCQALFGSCPLSSRSAAGGQTWVDVSAALMSNIVVVV